MTDTRPLCLHCGGPARGLLGARVSAPLCRPELALDKRPPDCAALVRDWGHPTPCVDCDGLMGEEFGVPGLAWLAGMLGTMWDADAMMEAVTW